MVFLLKWLIFLNIINLTLFFFFSDSDTLLELFPKISHVQQRTEDEMNLWELPNIPLFVSIPDENILNFNISSMHIGAVTGCSSTEYQICKITRVPPVPLLNIKNDIKGLKKECPNFPVYKMFRILQQKCGKRYVVPEKQLQEKKTEVKIEIVKKRKRGRPKKKKDIVDDNSIIIDSEVLEIAASQKAEINMCSAAIWTEKYKPISSEEIIGNNSSVLELRNWLSTWIEYSFEQRTTNRKRRRINSGSSDDFCSRNDTKDTDVVPLNTMILLGSCGSGKTSTVYALCNELNINVIELNASSKRPGKRILQELQEATKSHQVKNTDVASVGSFFHKVDDSSKDGDISKKDMSLLLVEDADIVFDEQDDGFVSALGSLVASSKRPIIITSSDSNCAHLQKFISQHKVITFNNLSSKILGTWLQILCFVEGIRVDVTEVSKLLDWNKGDVRKTILQLQFWAQSGGDLHTNSVETNAVNSSRCVSTEPDLVNDDENSNLSWLSIEEIQKEINSSVSEKIHHTCVQCFTAYLQNDKLQFQLPYPINLGTFWWNLPNIYEFKSKEHNKMFTNTEIKTLQNEVYSNPDIFSTQDSEVVFRQTNKDELKAIGDMLDIVAFTDVVYKKRNLNFDFEPSTDFWKIEPVNSLSLEQNLELYNETSTTSLEIVQCLVESSVKQYQEISKNKFENLCFNPAVPILQEQR